MQTRIFLLSIQALGLALISFNALSADVDKTVAQKNGWAEYAKQLDIRVARVNTACGSNISASYDKSTYSEFDPIKDRTQSACQQGVEGLVAVCSTEAGKSAAKTLKTASCRLSVSGTGVAMEGSTLFINIDPQKSSIVGKQPGSYTWSSALKEIL